MQPLSSITRIEFFGGPEDGRVLEADLFFQLAGGETAEMERLAMLARDESAPGSVFHVVGTYVASEKRGKTLLYRWEAVVG